MRHTHLHLLGLTLALAALLLPSTLRAQHITQLNLPTDLCAGQSRSLSFGYRPQRNIVIYKPQVSLGESQRIFLPDGKNCQGTGCSYKSHVTFNAFEANSTVASVQDIKYVRLNIEHSFIGDLYINITCPNGQKADLMKKHSTGQNSDCAYSIPASSKGWKTGGYNTDGSTFFGNANDDQAAGGGWGYGGYGSNTAYCDSTAAGNEPGVGWNYCWSNNTTSGYQYAPGDAYIYRSANAHYIGYSTNRAIDSSNVGLGRNFYHPDDNFSALIGCPLNGDWYIEVMDGYSQDNGYLFGWEIALNENRLLQDTCTVLSYEIVGPYITPGSNDSTFTLAVPTDLERDTTVLYRFVLHLSCGDVDTVAPIRLHPSYHIESDTVVCDQLRIGASTYTASTLIVANGRTIHQCDSNLRLDLTVLHSSAATLAAEIIENDLPYAVGGILIDHAVSDTILHLPNAAGCDSMLNFSLVVHPNTNTYLDTSICAIDAPLYWHGHTFEQTDSAVFVLPDRYGADSTVHLHVTIHPETDTTISLVLPESMMPYNFMHQLFTASADTSILATNAAGCDSLIRFQLTVLPSQHSVEEYHLCDVDTPFVWNNLAFATDTTISLDLTAYNGADSVAELRLWVHPSFDTTLADTTCDNIGLNFGNRHLTTSGHYEHTFLTAFGCDSLVRLDLVVNNHTEEYFTDSVCNNRSVLFDDTLFHSTGRHIVRYTTAEGCDSLRILDLTLLDPEFAARAKASTTIATVQNPVLMLHNTSFHAASFRWIIEADTLEGSPLRYHYPISQDSVEALLVAYSLHQCTDTARLALTIDRSALLTPNVFTPSIEQNNRWAPALSDIIELGVWIYNRQGNLVAQWSDVGGSWDGTSLDGTPLPQAVYVYRLQYRTRVRPEQLQSQKGTITLIR